MQRPRRANGRLRKARTRRKSVCRWETVAGLGLPGCSLPLRPRLLRVRRRAEEEGAVASGAATEVFCLPKRKLRLLHPPMLLVVEAAASVIPPPAISASGNLV